MANDSHPHQPLPFHVAFLHHAFFQQSHDFSNHAQTTYLNDFANDSRLEFQSLQQNLNSNDHPLNLPSHQSNKHSNTKRHLNSWFFRAIHLSVVLSRPDDLFLHRTIFQAFRASSQNDTPTIVHDTTLAHTPHPYDSHAYNRCCSFFHPAIIQLQELIPQDFYVHLTQSQKW